jgi:hypothetical protein
VAAQNPQVVESHRKRVDALTDRLAAPSAPLHEVSEKQRERLRSLGYVE